ncbi:Hypothetical protein PHPALM_37454, partial [Phytophthora palmivora]
GTAVDDIKQAGDYREEASGNAPVSELEAKNIKQALLSDVTGKTSDADMREADGGTSADAATQGTGDANSEFKAPEVNMEGAPEFKTPRHATLEDVRGLIFAGMLRQEEIDPPDFLVPECPPHWKLPAPPDLKTNAYLVNDIRAKHTDFTGNWERLYDLFKLCAKDMKPPESWDTVVNVAAMAKLKAAVSPYPEKSQRMPPSPGSHPTNRLEVISRVQAAVVGVTRALDSQASDTQLQPTYPKVHKAQRRPKDHQPGHDSVRRAGEKTVVSKEAAHSMLPGGVVWKEDRPDVRQAIVAGLKYDTAMEWIGNDRAAHGYFRQPQLVKMLVSMNVLASSRQDPLEQPPAQEPEETASISSFEEEEEEIAPEIMEDDEEAADDDGVETKKPLESEPPVKRPRSGSNERSQGSNPKPKKQRRKAVKKNTSAPQGSTKDPENGETSWRIYGVLVQYPSSTKSASCQTPGFPEYEIHKYSYDVVHDRWNREAYQEVLDSEPWVTMLQGRIRVFYFHERDMLYAKALKRVEDIVDAMHKHAQAIWERGHWVPVPTEEKAEIAMESQRKSRRNALRRAFKTLLDRSHDTPGFLTAIDDEEWLQYVPDNVKRHIKPVAIRKLNPLSLTRS